MTYTPRFIDPSKVPALLDCWRLTAVGWPVHEGDASVQQPHSRWGRMRRAGRSFVRMGYQDGISETAAYKDLDNLLGVGPGQLLTGD